MKNFASYITDFATKTPNSPAIVSPEGVSCSYQELRNSAGSLAKFLEEQKIKRLGVLADKTVGAYIGVIGSAWNAIAYVPFSLKAPSQRLCDQLKASHAEAVLIDENGVKTLNDNLIKSLPAVVIATDEEVQNSLSDKGVKSVVIEVTTTNKEPSKITGEEEAYIIFTSGSSGTPKGVLISTAARDAFFSEYQQRFDILPSDRVAQPADLSWDVSIENMAYALTNGASLYLMSRNTCFSPVEFIQKSGITVWDSVPTTAEIMFERGHLKPNTFPKLRITVFGGAALSPQVAKLWQEACPNSIVVNSYGPTEMTVACIDYRIPKDFDGDTVPLGNLFSNTEGLILTEDGKIAGPNEPGELLLSGIQQAEGYLDDKAKTDEAFVWREDANGQKKRWYKTGDVIYQDKDGLYYFKGRTDCQLKVMGYRIELEEVEAYLKKILKIEQVAVMGYPFDETNVDDLIGFIEVSSDVAKNLSSHEIIVRMLENLPLYMVPRTFYALETLPRMANGKLNRKALSEQMTDDKLI